MVIRIPASIRNVVTAQAARFARLFAATFTVSLLAALQALSGPVDTKALVALVAALVVAAAESAFRQWIKPVVGPAALAGTGLTPADLPAVLADPGVASAVKKALAANGRPPSAGTPPIR